VIPSDVDVRVRGSSSTVARIAPGEVRAVLDVADAKPGQNLFHLAPDQVSAPFGVEVSYVGPATVPLFFERQMTKVVPVVPLVEGEPAPGYERQRVTVEPAEVEVEGPESAVRDLHQATTGTVQLKSSAAQVRETVTIGVLNNARRNAECRRHRRHPAGQAERTDAVPVRMQQLRAGQWARSTPERGGDARRRWNAEAAGRGRHRALSVDESRRRDTAPEITPSRLFGIVRIDPSQVQITIR
jgi:hypothetical protein